MQISRRSALTASLATVAPRLAFGRRAGPLPAVVVVPDNAGEIVLTAARELQEAIQSAGGSAEISKESRFRADAVKPVYVRLAHGSSEKLGVEGYLITTLPGGNVAVESEGNHGLLWGGYRLAALLHASRAVPEGLRVATKPFFPIREWATMTYQGNFNLPLGGAFDRPPEELLELTFRNIRQAPRYGIQALQLTGRPEEGGIDLSWLVKYRKYPKVYSYYRHDYARDARIDILRRVGREAHHYGLQLLLWDHELLYPPELLKEYPYLGGGQVPLSEKARKDFVEAKVDEFFEVCPEADGLVLTYSEVGPGFRLFQAGPKAVLDTALAMNEACRRNGKRLEIRDYFSTWQEARVMEEAMRGLPKDVVVMSKCVAYDFFGSRRVDNPLIGKAVSPQILEFTMCREDSGHGFIPGIAPQEYVTKLRRGVGLGVAGAMARLDYHLQYSHANGFNPGLAETAFDRPNEFDVVALSSLMWAPDVDIEPLWREWAKRKYGENAAPHVVAALKRTEDITQKMFFVQDEYVVHQHNQTTTLEYMRGCLSGPTTQAYWDPEDRKLTDRLHKINHPTEETLAEFLAEKREATRLADLSLEDLRRAKPHMVPDVYRRLLRSMAIEREASALWHHYAEVFFRLLMWEQNTGDRDSNLMRMNAAGQAYLQQIIRIQSRFGNVWPVNRAARGVPARFVILECWRPQLERIEPVTVAVEQVWDAVNGLSLPVRPADQNHVCLRFSPAISKVAFDGDQLEVAGRKGARVRLPLGIEAVGPVLQGDHAYNLVCRRERARVSVQLGREPA